VHADELTAASTLEDKLPEGLVADRASRRGSFYILADPQLPNLFFGVIAAVSINEWE
jgi:hypothetical protein